MKTRHDGLTMLDLTAWLLLLAVLAVLAGPHRLAELLIR